MAERNQDELHEALAQAHARLCAHEFMLEILFARLFAERGLEASKQFAAEFNSKMKSGGLPDDLAAQPGSRAVQKPFDDARIFAERFMENALRRGCEIRLRMGAANP